MSVITVSTLVLTTAGHWAHVAETGHCLRLELSSETTTSAPVTGCVVGGRPGLGFVKAGGKLEVGWERRSEMEAWAGRNGRFHLQRVGRTHNKPAKSECYRRETKLYNIQSFRTP
ncbi:hypothetical protein Bbelb_423310 [Branchiostoma belcheri]|nr:hypothetical protein Bbelb_423310 [Branchiostoma belcheri]